MTKAQRIIHAALMGFTAAIIVLPIIFAPVMREPGRTMSATAYFGDAQ